MGFFEKVVRKWIERYNLLTILVTLIFAIPIIGFIKHWILNLCASSFQVLIYTTCDAFLSASNIYKQILLIVVLIFVVYLMLKIWESSEPIRIKVARADKRIISIPPISNWIYQGSLKVKNSLEITRSNSGALIRKCKFRNFRMSFQVAILEDSHIGIIFRAQDLENYLMLQITKEYPGCRYISINPHIRFLGVFEVFRKPYYCTSLTCSGADDPMEVYLEVKHRDVFVKINKINQPLSDEFKWTIPTHVEITDITKYLQNDQDKNGIELKSGTKSELWFGNRYGMVGFRASGKEKFLIKDLKIEKI